MDEKITLDRLTQDLVSVKKQSYAVVEGKEYPIGKPHRKAYANSIQERLLVQNELPQQQQNAIFAIWGDTPTVTETTE